MSVETGPGNPAPGYPQPFLPICRAPARRHKAAKQRRAHRAAHQQALPQESFPPSPRGAAGQGLHAQRVQRQAHSQHQQAPGSTAASPRTALGVLDRNDRQNLGVKHVYLQRDLSELWNPHAADASKAAERSCRSSTSCQRLVEWAGLPGLYKSHSTKQSIKPSSPAAEVTTCSRNTLVCATSKCFHTTQ